MELKNLKNWPWKEIFIQRIIFIKLAVDEDFLAFSLAALSYPALSDYLSLL